MDMLPSRPTIEQLVEHVFEAEAGGVGFSSPSALRLLTGTSAVSHKKLAIPHDRCDCVSIGYSYGDELLTGCCCSPIQPGDPDRCTCLRASIVLSISSRPLDGKVWRRGLNKPP